MDGQKNERMYDQNEKTPVNASGIIKVSYKECMLLADGSLHIVSMVGGR